jgi:hypothetical protein
VVVCVVVVEVVVVVVVVEVGVGVVEVVDVGVPDVLVLVDDEPFTFRARVIMARGRERVPRTITVSLPSSTLAEILSRRPLRLFGPGTLITRGRPCSTRSVSDLPAVCGRGTETIAV